MIAAFLGWQDARNDRFKALLFGDNSPLPSDVLEDIAAFMDRNKVAYKWKKGDILALNNRLVMHSRNSFSGPRKIYASIWGDVRVPEQVARNQLASQTAEPDDPLVFGFWKVSDSERVAYDAISLGYRRLDCACDYGNEVQTGRGISKAISEGICTRSELYITSKLWNTFHNPHHVLEACNRSLKDLGLDYLDGICSIFLFPLLSCHIFLY